MPSATRQKDQAQKDQVFHDRKGFESEKRKAKSE
jgi:hypothetical protein